MSQVQPFVERKLVNGHMLRDQKNTISIMLEVVEETGSTLLTKSTDGQDVRVRLPDNDPLNARPGNWVEVIGTPQGNADVKANEVILFNDENIDFDKDSYNMMVLFLNNAKEIFHSG